MKLDSIHQLLVKWSTGEYGWLSGAITLERSSIRAAKALSLIEINDTRRGLVDDSGAFFLCSDRWLRQWDLGVIVYSTRLLNIHGVSEVFFQSQTCELVNLFREEWNAMKLKGAILLLASLGSAKLDVIAKRETLLNFILVQKYSTFQFPINFQQNADEKSFARVDRRQADLQRIRSRGQLISRPTKFSMKPL